MSVQFLYFETASLVLIKGNQILPEKEGNLLKR